MQNLQLLIRNIEHFYLTQLQQLVITALPNITHIAHYPETGKSLKSKHYNDQCIDVVMEAGSLPCRYQLL